MSTSSKLAGKTAIVTGASKGIGASIAIHLAAEGAEVVVNYSSDQAGADKTVAEITAAGGKAVAVKASVAVPAEIEHLVAESVKAFGKVDILVNNAGVYQFAPLEETTPELFHRQFDINVLGLILTTQAAVRHFPAEGGSIINISSVASTLGMPGGAVYCGTKAAVDAVTRSLAKELGGRGIRVNSINPGMVTTEGTASAGIDGSDFQKTVIATTPLGRIGVPQDIATAAVFLASSDSSWISGETLFISGGFR
ncbi:glucose 1-dehydrogenase [Luteolibacter yonseiensis]|uniref:Glucose 1-dehydrogenase n=1 Tax=Luteolibacter yonseiensis TaxID=1144680 RepID=A0A934R2Z0_9BACT|nr:glucose 1-dehydrogenase [Luteolibacter yonseiensis]MBK1814545.1 glucose 1-dehydrogenase [Luteolibacter yonseiensis]